jgi:membrane-bound metal-dependent hydrolase YbcI (DUF457 family)
MRNPTHVVAGAVAALGLGCVAQVPIGVPEVVAGAIAGLLPNVDYFLPALEKSRLPAFRRIANRAVGGGISHAAAVALPLAGLLGTGAALVAGRPGLLVAVLAGVLSHLLLDLFGKTGLQLWAPFSRAWIAFPPWERLRPHRGGAVEVAVFAGGLALLAFLGVRELLPYAARLAQLLLGGGR